jgi:hypothetical protein
MELLGMIRFEPTDSDRLLPSLCDVVRAGVSGDHLVTATRKLLYQNRFVVPGTRRLSNLVQAAVSSVEFDILSKIERSIPVVIRNRWLDALSGLADPDRKMTLLEYLQEPPAKFSPSAIERQSVKVRELLDLGCTLSARFCERLLRRAYRDYHIASCGFGCGTTEAKEHCRAPARNLSRANFANSSTS